MKGAQTGQLPSLTRGPQSREAALGSIKGAEWRPDELGLPAPVILFNVVLLLLRLLDQVELWVFWVMWARGPE